MIIGAVITLYIVGNTVIHIKRDDYRQDTLIEYILIGAAVFVVLVSALR